MLFLKTMIVPIVFMVFEEILANSFLNSKFKVIFEKIAYYLLFSIQLRKRFMLSILIL